jgi:hypothetical protein
MVPGQSQVNPDSNSWPAARDSATADAGMTHERIGWPSTCTVHAPHRALPQPNLVPVMPRRSRRTHNSGVSSEAAAYTTVLLMESAIGKTSWSVDPFNARLDSSVRPCGCAGRDQRVGTPTARLLRQRHAENE